MIKRIHSTVQFSSYGKHRIFPIIFVTLTIFDIYFICFTYLYQTTDSKTQTTDSKTANISICHKEKNASKRWNYKYIPYTVYQYPYELIDNLESKCYENSGIPSEIHVLYLIKSGLHNFGKRQVIRKTWGNDTRLQQYKIKKVFILGIDSTDSIATEKMLNESATFGDMLIGSYEDTYYNVTIKAMMGVNWCREFCPHAKFYVMMDDNSYISTRNLLKLLNDKKRFLPSQELSFLYTDANDSALTTTSLDNSYRLYGGTLFGSAPVRSPSAWFVSEQEYPYDTYPTYISGIAFLANFAAFEAFYEASLVTKYFRFDDTYFGFVSLKSGIVPIEIPEFSVNTMNFSRIQDFETIIASHPYSLMDTMIAWEIENQFFPLPYD